MYDFRYRLLVALGTAATCSGCALATERTSHNYEMYISGNVARTSAWNRSIYSCSSKEYFCAEIPGMVIFAFPRNCSELKKPIKQINLPINYHIVGLDAHFMLPTASYVSRKYPKTLLFYERSRGFTEIRLLKFDVFDIRFDPNNFTERFILKSDSKDGFFVCS